MKILLMKDLSQNLQNNISENGFYIRNFKFTGGS